MNKLFIFTLLLSCISPYINTVEQPIKIQNTTRAKAYNGAKQLGKIVAGLLLVDSGLRGHWLCKILPGTANELQNKNSSDSSMQNSQVEENTSVLTEEEELEKKRITKITKYFFDTLDVNSIVTFVCGFMLIKSGCTGLYQAWQYKPSVLNNN